MLCVGGNTSKICEINSKDRSRSRCLSRRAAHDCRITPGIIEIEFKAATAGSRQRVLWRNRSVNQCIKLYNIHPTYTDTRSSISGFRAIWFGLEDDSELRRLRVGDAADDGDEAAAATGAYQPRQESYPFRFPFRIQTRNAHIYMLSICECKAPTT